MKRSLLVLPLAVILNTASMSTFANSGTINFTGSITSTTCPIQIIDPVTGNPTGSLVNIGTVSASQFTVAGQEVGNRGFGLRLIPGGGCTVNAGDTAAVTFTGVKDTTGDYFAFKPVNGPASGVVASIRDDKGALVANGKASRDFDLDVTAPTDMMFYVAHRSTSATVTAGSTEADVRFTIAIN
ncbi:fimbrial protein [Pseudomonas alliivorans]|uniref:Type 1 fimbrial protein n=1 Tax=Pseudomonas alliivorans TaxID=2810613 RepID=A0ABS4CD13_9PSED|nr:MULTISPECIES: fimbrial protein [Pseudomonas]MBP0940380.1 type 1 fimbrial protein [Pseudomonas alliivorans]MBP0948606.1 type 1 fimbrial protein [Pseudomonas alliivorans]MBP0949714.1 type 1 fimbrial protein [Pseudomonas alliivorans]MCO5368702.1 type 1 fimbrial protein [Pseudomonas alliivorans]MEE4306450.1 fimbrial protein [Pseudomonas alliivorans]